MNRGRIKWTIAAKLTVGTILATAIPLVFISTLILYLRTRALNDRAEEATIHLAELKAAEIERAAFQLENEVEVLTFNAEGVYGLQQVLNSTADPVAVEQASNALKDLTDTDGVYYAALYSTGNLALLMQQGPEAVSLSDAQLRSLATIRTTTIYAIRPASNSNFMLLDVAVPMRSANNQIPGYVIVTLSVETLVTSPGMNLTDPFLTINDQPKFLEVPAAYIGVLDYSGRVLAASTGPASPQAAYPRHPAIQAVHSAETFTREAAHYQSGINHEKVIGSYKTVANRQWIVIVEIPEAEVWQPLLSTTLPLVVGMAVILLVINVLWHTWLYRSLQVPLRSLVQRLHSFSLLDEGGPELGLTERTDEIGNLHNTFVRMVHQISTTISALRTRNQKHIRYWQLLLEISQLSQKIQDVRFLAEELTRLVRNNAPDVSYIQVFFVDDKAQVARLQAGTGEVGRRLLAQEYLQPLMMDNIIGRVALTGEAVIVPNLSRESHYRQAEIFSDSFSEIVVPVLMDEQVIGVIDAHSRRPDAFSEQELRLLRVLAAQLTAASITQQRLQNLTQSQSLIIKHGYSPHLLETLSARAGRAVGPEEDWTPLQRQAMTSGTVAIETNDPFTTFAIPIKLRHEVLGAVELIVETHRFNPTLLQITEALVDRLALAIDNARLFEQSQRLIARERLVNAITQKLTSQTDVRQILQVAVRELGQALGTPETQISLKIQDQNSDTT